MVQIKSITETAFASQVESLLEIYGWRWLHLRPAFSQKGWRVPIRGGDPDGFKGKGFPDYIAVRPPRLLFAELKNDKAELAPAQEAWINDLLDCWILGGPSFNGEIGVPEVYLWRPSQINEVAKILSWWE